MHDEVEVEEEVVIEIDKEKTRNVPGFFSWKNSHS